ncbi:MAG: SDR family oxidoreductase [Daejeonella sp.]|uniref:SDR family oxidoreductase n=1 Tax=Daejeonella sp. TaxID=2805397 RepID=UPI002734389C|nr:SDR family oxidoreductase [Daejeonella sp.]MDP3468810.1 SDR family oxidoreductase [Daejeonella sp.]
MKRILVTGSNGLLGQKLTDLCVSDPEVELIASSKGPNRHPVKNGYIYEDMDILDPKQIQRVVEKYHPDTIINTAAMTNVDACESDKENCYALNVETVKSLIGICEQHKIQLIHLSTDFIFDGENGPYTEEDHPNPLSYYGQTKLEAEQLLQKSTCRWVILRTIIVYGIVNDMSRSNIILWAKGALEKGSPINVVDDQWRMPTLAEDLAECCLLAAKKNAEGIFNASGKDMLSILEMVKMVADYWKLDQSLINPISADSLNQTANRPKKTGFILDKAKRVLGYNPRSFEEGIAFVDTQIKAISKSK